MTTLYDPTREEIAAILEGEASYRLDQLWTGMYTHFKKPSEIQTLPAALRAKLDAELPEGLIEIRRETSERFRGILFQNRKKHFDAKRPNRPIGAQGYNTNVE